MFPASLHSAGRQYFKTVGEGQRFLPLETHQRAKWCPQAKNDAPRILHPVRMLFLCLIGIGRLTEGHLSPCVLRQRGGNCKQTLLSLQPNQGLPVGRKRTQVQGFLWLSLAVLWRWKWVSKSPSYLVPLSLLIPSCLRLSICAWTKVRSV